MEMEARLRTHKNTTKSTLFSLSRTLINGLNKCINNLLKEILINKFKRKDHLHRLSQCPTEMIKDSEKKNMKYYN